MKEALIILGSTVSLLLISSYLIGVICNRWGPWNKVKELIESFKPGKKK